MTNRRYNHKKTIPYNRLLDESNLTNKSILRLLYDKYIPVLLKPNTNTQYKQQPNVMIEYLEEDDQLLIMWE